MSSGKQRRAEIKNRRAIRKAKAIVKRPPKPLPTGTASVNEALLAPNNSYGAPQFVYRGYYPQEEKDRVSVSGTNSRTRGKLFGCPTPATPLRTGI